MHRFIDHLIARLPRLRRSRHFRTSAMVALMVLAGGVTLNTLNTASATRNVYGQRRVVTIAQRDLEIGHVIDVADIERRELPVALIPGGSDSGGTENDAGNTRVEPVEDAIGRTVLEPVYSGEVLLSGRLSKSITSGPRAVVAASSRVVSVERSPLIPSLQTGDRVDLCAPGVGARAAVVARGALVVDVDETSVAVAIDEAELPAAARAIIDGDVILALIGER